MDRPRARGLQPQRRGEEAAQAAALVDVEALVNGAPVLYDPLRVDPGVRKQVHQSREVLTMSERTCARCGRGFPGRGRARFCRAACRQAAMKARKMGLPERSPVVLLNAAAPAVAAAEGTAEPMDRVGLARVLAAAIAAPTTPPTAVAGLSREYRATLAEVEAEAPRAPDGIDDIARRRAAREARMGGGAS